MAILIVATLDVSKIDIFLLNGLFVCDVMESGSDLNISATFLSPATPEAQDGRYCNAPPPIRLSVCLSVRHI